jgi:hypothetical protein
MNNQEKYSEDLLRQYITPEQVEKAPEGFTSKVMSQIQIEPLQLKERSRLRNRNLIPVISWAITVLLILAALLIPESKTDSVVLTFSQLFNGIKITLPEFDLSSVFNFSMPSLLTYIIIGILFLSLFDKMLSMFFHREK